MNRADRSRRAITSGTSVCGKPASNPAVNGIERRDRSSARLQSRRGTTRQSGRYEISSHSDDHPRGTNRTLVELRRSYDLLMMKVLSLLQDRDQKLASEIVSSREQIWGLLVDPKKFAALQA